MPRSYRSTIRNNHTHSRSNNSSKMEHHGYSLSSNNRTSYRLNASGSILRSNMLEPQHQRPDSLRATSLRLHSNSANSTEGTERSASMRSLGMINNNNGNQTNNPADATMDLQEEAKQARIHAQVLKAIGKYPDPPPSKANNNNASSRNILQGESVSSASVHASFKSNHCHKNNSSWLSSSSRRIFGGLLSPRALSLSQMDISSLPPEAATQIRDKQVEKLVLSRNEPMVVVPECLVQTRLPCLKVLDLSRCQIVILPDVVWDLPHLTHLDLSRNRLRDFPSKFVLQGVPLLKELNLYGNRLMNLPEFAHSQAASAGNASDPKGLVTSPANTNNENTSANGTPVMILTHLQVLNVGYNDLTFLPERLPPSVRTFIACNNFLSEVPASLILEAPPTILKEVDVSSNPMSDPPSHICQAGLRAMRKHFQARLQQQPSSDAAIATSSPEDNLGALHQRPQATPKRASFSAPAAGSSQPFWRQQSQEPTQPQDTIPHILVEPQPSPDLTHIPSYRRRRCSSRPLVPGTQSPSPSSNHVGAPVPEVVEFVATSEEGTAY